MLHNNKITTLFFTLFILNNCNQVKIDKNALFIPNKIGQISVIHEDNKFKVQSSTGTHEVKPWHMNKELRNIPQDQILKLLALGSSYLHVNNMEGNNEEYSLKLHHRLKGGGAGGATAGFWIGKLLTHAVGHGTIQIIAACTGPAYAVTSATLEASFTPMIESASNVVGLACGVAGGTATGPV